MAPLKKKRYTWGRRHAAPLKERALSSPEARLALPAGLQLLGALGGALEGLNSMNGQLC